MTRAQRQSRRGLDELERERRRQEFLDASWEVVVADGFEALTMSRVTAIVGSAEGTIYNYFASKEALLAEMQEAALTVIAGSIMAALTDLQSKAKEVDPQVMALAALLVGARVWVDIEQEHPREVELSRRIFSYSGQVFDDEVGESVASAAQRPFDFACALIDSAVDAGALAPGNSLERAVAALAGTNGILMAGSLARWDPRLVDVREFAHNHVRDLFVSWGADPEVLGRALTLITDLPST